MHRTQTNSLSVCCSLFFSLPFSTQRLVLTVIYRLFTQLELQHFTQICQQCVLKSLSVGSRSPWTQLSSIFTVWGLTASKRGPISAPAYFSPCGAENAASVTPQSHTTDGGITSTAFLHSRHYKLSTPEISLKRSIVSTLVFTMNAGNDGCETFVCSLLRSVIALLTKCYVDQLFFVPTSNPKYLSPPPE